MINQGRCYQLAFDFLVHTNGFGDSFLVHGSIEAVDPETKQSRRIAHAWIETDAGYVYKPVSSLFMKLEEFENKFQPIRTKSYSKMEAMLLAYKYRHYGLWDE